MKDLQNRQKGCFYGLAIGDALGVPVEMKQAGTFPPVLGYRDAKSRRSLAGEWSDDTSMALALADSLANGHCKKDQLDKYVDWYKNGKYTPDNKCFGMGGTTRKSLENYIATGELESPLVEAMGNGSIMRLAPVAIRFATDPSLKLIAVESSATTHSSPTCRSACEYMAVILSGLLRGLSREQVLDPTWKETASLELVPEVREVANGSFLTDVVDGRGHVIESLKSALWAFYDTNSFEQAVLRAVNLGNDSDTTGAIAGQFAGAHYGYDSIPEYLIEGLARKEMIDEYLNKILYQ
jgi:ADP-ribosyl-[dinitrogen reductase] hydrolase